LIEAETYRWKGHSKSDANRYRTPEEIESWKRRCPIRRFRERMIAEGAATPDEADAIKRQAEADIEAAVRFAMSSPEPDLSEVMTDVFA
jgi:pyruvate dehydrogenase E1 component alpha subunit